MPTDGVHFERTFLNEIGATVIDVMDTTIDVCLPETTVAKRRREERRRLGNTASAVETHFGAEKFDSAAAWPLKWTASGGATPC